MPPTDSYSHNQACYGSRWCSHCQRRVSGVHDKHVTDGYY